MMIRLWDRDDPCDRKMRELSDDAMLTAFLQWKQVHRTELAGRKLPEQLRHYLSAKHGQNALYLETEFADFIDKHWVYL